MTSSPPTPHGNSERDRLLLKATAHIAETWLSRLPAEDTRRSDVLAIIRFVKSQLDGGDVATFERVRTVSMFCASCQAIHPILTANCVDAEIKDLDLENCLLFSLLSGTRP